MSMISPNCFSCYPPPSKFSSGLNSQRVISCSSVPMGSNEKLKANFMEFPYASAQQKALMVELFSAVETRLGPSLEPYCTLPSDVQHYESSTGAAYGSLNVRSGLASSQIDFILGSWIHCKMPTGETVNITSLSAYLKSSTDAPHLLLDLIQSSATSLIMILDLTPRKDLILYPNYFKTYYEETQLDKHRQYIQSLPGVRPYYYPTLHIRAILSPAAILVHIDRGADDAKTMEEMIRAHIGPIAREMLQYWMDECACLEKRVEADEQACLERRDGIVKSSIMEVLEFSIGLSPVFGTETKFL